MNYSIIIYILGWIMNVEAVCMLVPGITALIYREKSGIAFLITILACLAIGVPLVSRKPSKKAFYAREGLVTTALSWIVLSIVGAVPFVLSGAIPNPIDAFFEIVSGFTTTGSSILSDPSQMPYSINIWRCFSHWIGGMGAGSAGGAAPILYQRRGCVLQPLVSPGLPGESVEPGGRRPDGGGI